MKKLVLKNKSLLTIHIVINMAHLIILFDALIKFKSVSVPYHLVDSFCEYCIKRGKIVMGGIMHEEYQYFYID